jgi:hypothetical protein
MGIISWIGHEKGWDDRKIRKVSAVLDLVYLLGFIAMLYWAWSYMGQVHSCLELAKAQCGGSFNNSINIIQNFSGVR